MTDTRMREIVSSVFAVIGWQMRECDYQVVLLLTDPPPPECLPTVLIQAAAEYAWDHLMGKPKRPTPKMIVSEYKRREYNKIKSQNREGKETI